MAVLINAGGRERNDWDRSFEKGDVCFRYSSATELEVIKNKCEGVTLCQGSVPYIARSGTQNSRCFSMTL
jgi:hypothetical protein